MPLPFDQITGLYRQFIQPDIVDNIYKSNVFFHRLNAMKKVVGKWGRMTVQQPVLTTKEANVGSYTPYGILGTTPTDIATAASWELGTYYAQPVISRQELAKATDNGKEGVIDLMDAKIQNATLTLYDKLGTDLYTGTGTAADGSKTIVGLSTVISAVAAYGGIAVADMADWVAGYIDGTATALSALTLFQIKKAIGGLTIGSDRPTVGFTTQAVYDKIWSLVQTNERYTYPSDSKKVEVGGWEAIMIGGVPIFVDNHLPTGLFVAGKDSIIFLNENYLKFYIHADNNFEWELLPAPVDQDIVVNRIRFYGQLTTSKRKAHGAITNLDPAA